MTFTIAEIVLSNICNTMLTTMIIIISATLAMNREADKLKKIYHDSIKNIKNLHDNDLKSMKVTHDYNLKRLQLRHEENMQALCEQYKRAF